MVTRKRRSSFPAAVLPSWVSLGFWRRYFPLAELCFLWGCFALAFFLGFLLLVIMTVVSLYNFSVICLRYIFLFSFILSLHLCCPVFLSPVFRLYLPSVTSEANLLVVIFLYLSTALKLLCSGTCQIDVINSGVAFLFSFIFRAISFLFLFTCSLFFLFRSDIFFL